MVTKKLILTMLFLPLNNSQLWWLNRFCVFIRCLTLSVIGLVYDILPTWLSQAYFVFLRHFALCICGALSYWGILLCVFVAFCLIEAYCLCLIKLASFSQYSTTTSKTCIVNPPSLTDKAEKQSIFMNQISYKKIYTFIIYNWEIN